MKKSIISCLAALCCCTLLFSQSTDEATAKALTLRETERYYARDWEDWANCWAHSSHTYWSANNRTGFLEYKGWEALHTSFEKEFKDYPNVFWKGKIELLDWQFHLNGNLATASFKQVRTADSTGVVYESSEQRVFEKQSDGWKILSAHVLSYGPNWSVLNLLHFDIYHAMENGCSPESLARANTEWEKKTLGMEKLTPQQFHDNYIYWYDEFALKPQVLELNQSTLRIKRLNLEKLPILRRYLNRMGNKGALFERYLKEYARTQAEAFGLVCQIEEEGDFVLETYAIK